jgi:hypothetical protein
MSLVGDNAVRRTGPSAAGIASRFDHHTPIHGRPRFPKPAAPPPAAAGRHPRVKFGIIKALFLRKTWAASSCAAFPRNAPVSLQFLLSPCGFIDLL